MTDLAVAPPPPEVDRPQRKVLRIAAWIVGTILVLVALHLAGIDVIGWFEDLWDTLTEISIGYIVLGCFFQGLQTVLTAPVVTQTSSLRLGPELLATPAQFDVRKVAELFIRTTAAEGSAPSFKYLIIPHDLKFEPLRYVFSTSFGDETTPHHVGVLSTARLDQGGETTARRVYKLILKSIARIAGRPTLPVPHTTTRYVMGRD